MPFTRHAPSIGLETEVKAVLAQKMLRELTLKNSFFFFFKKNESINKTEMETTAVSSSLPICLGGTQAALMYNRLIRNGIFSGSSYFSILGGVWHRVKLRGFD